MSRCSDCGPVVAALQVLRDRQHGGLLHGWYLSSRGYSGQPFPEPAPAAARPLWRCTHLHNCASASPAWQSKMVLQQDS